MKSIAIILNIIIFIINVQCKSKYYDGEDRPYEFGFNIDGNQHRHEKKDANGIIMGEYGFITADQIYHITKYATDENGNFKILSMENININKLKELRAKQAMAKNAAPITSTSITPLTTTIPTTTTPPIPLLRIVASTIIPKQYTPPKTLDIPSCSNCRIPAPVVESMLEYFEEKTNDNSSPPPPQPQPPQPPLNDNKDKINNEPFDTMARFGTQSNTHESEEIINNPAIQENNNEYNNNQEHQQYQNQPAALNSNPNNNEYMNNNNNNNEQKYPQNSISQDQNHNVETVPSNENTYNNRDYNNNNNINNINNNNNNNNNYDNNNFNNNQNIISKDEMQNLLTGLLYRFNYTVGFHGHHEEGDANGSKKGSYFVTGRDGIKRIVNYTADESGFHPIIEEEMVSGDQIPNEASEKEAGLKGYEFKWFN